MKPFQQQEEYETSKAKLEELADAHRLAVAHVGETKIAYDDAISAERLAKEVLDKANAEYMELEKKVEAENAKED